MSFLLERSVIVSVVRKKSEESGLICHVTRLITRCTEEAEGEEEVGYKLERSGREINWPNEPTVERL